MILDISPLSSAIARTEEMLANCRNAAIDTSPSVQKQLRAGAIQGFEFTYELSFKILRRYLQETEPSAVNIKEMSFHEIIRLGYARGLLNAEIKEWRIFRENRNATSHAYNERKIDEVFEAIPAFLQEAHFLRRQIIKRMKKL